jgi:hypothetical protein
MRKSQIHATPIEPLFYTGSHIAGARALYVYNTSIINLSLNQ